MSKVGDDKGLFPDDHLRPDNSSVEQSPIGSFESPYNKAPKAQAELMVEDFQPEAFQRLESAEPIPDPNEDFSRDAPPQPPAPDPFEEFKVEHRPLSSLMEDLPSLDGLFKPFNLEAVGPVQEEEPYEDLFDPLRAGDFVYEDLDTRDPDVIRTLAQAESRREEIIRAAEARASGLIESAVTEAKGLTAEAQTRSEAIVTQARQEAEEIHAAAEGHLTQAREELGTAQAEREAAEKHLADAEAQLAAAQDRIAGLDQEKERLETEFETRRAELTAKHAAQLAELEAAKATILAEAQTSGHQAGLEQGLAEGQAQGQAEALREFQDQVAGLTAIMAKMENIYNDLWAANEPLMLKLAIEAAEQILHKELTEDRELAACAFRACIDFLSQAHRVTFLARPQDIAQLEQAKAEERERLGALVKVSFRPDETLGPGDLIVESDIGRLDATVGHRSAQVLTVLREAFAGQYGHLEPEDDSSSAEPIVEDAPTPSAEAEPLEILDVEPEAAPAEPVSPELDDETQNTVENSPLT